MTGLTAVAASAGRGTKVGGDATSQPCRHDRPLIGGNGAGTGRHAAIAVVLALAAGPIYARQTSSPPAPSQSQGSLVIDPQQGATPRPLAPSPTLPPARSTPVPVASPVRTIDAPIALLPTPTHPTQSTTDNPRLRNEIWTQAVPGGLPAPSADPLRLDPTGDPILALARVQSSFSAFRQAIGAAVIRNPSLDEATAVVDEAEAAKSEARARNLPVADLSVSTFRIISRGFSNDPLNILERSRPSNRTDGLLRVQQPVFNFGANLNRIRASQARLEAARASVEDVGTQVALRAVSAWYTVYGYRALVRLGEAFATTQRSLRTNTEDRVRQGAAAAGDIAQVDSYIASSDTQLADFRRQLASAEAQYLAVVGSAAPADLSRAPAPVMNGIVSSTIASDTEKLPVVRAARLGVRAAESDVRALKSDLYPQLSAGIDVGRYGIVETARDYDIRGSLTLSMRIGGGALQRIDQAEARANGADARLRRIQIDAQRDAEIALSDVEALEDVQEAIESNYLASRRSRDVLAERFRVSRGTLFDLLIAQNNYFGIAARYIQTVIELDTARYALLARTGRLLPALDIQPAALEPR